MFNSLKSAIQWALILPGCLMSISPVLAEKGNATPVSPLESSCSEFKPISNAMPQAHSVTEPTQSTLQEDQSIPSVLPATSACSADLNPIPNQQIVQENTPTLVPEPNSPTEPPPSEIPGIQPLASEPNNNGWRFIFQPYATIPINTYGSATVRGRTVDYHLSLGSLLQSLSVAASGRVEAWNGNWGFIIDGYFAKLNAVKSFQRTEFPNLNAFNVTQYILSTDINGKLQGMSDALGQQFQSLEKADRAQKVQENIENVQILGQAIDRKIDEILSVQDLDQLKLKIAQTQDLIQETQQNFDGLQEIQNSEEFANLQDQLNTLKAFLNKELAATDQVTNYINDSNNQNLNNQDLNVDTTSNLSFRQGIYDFAISYHFGDPVSDRLPKEPSNRAFPLVWFQPYMGTRLNDINVNLNQIVNVQYTSDLINFQGNYQQTFSQGKTWFEPLVGGKFGVQLSDPITVWLRADVSGFDLSADSNWSWNALAGVDWWVNSQTSLQLGYRFYQIKLRNGTGENAFGFSESFNGPFLSASFHF
ncbi:MAG: hypothetical protein VKJ02_01800 [Snowella sp.]|nr:hypothetical protein [Snowella sp.]